MSQQHRRAGAGRPVASHATDIRAGLSVRQALDAIRASCKIPSEPETRRDERRVQYLETLRENLRDPIDAADAEVLTSVVHGEQPLYAVVKWFAQRPRPDWKAYLEVRERREEEWRRSMEAAIAESKRERARMSAGGPPFSELRAGLSVNQALAAFVQGCDGPNRLWAPNSWLEPRLALLCECLSGPVSTDVVEALRGAAEKRHSLDLVISWLKEGRKSWGDFVTGEAA